MRDALRVELTNMEEKLNNIRKELDDASNLLITSSQVASEQEGSMRTLSKGTREKVCQLLTYLLMLMMLYSLTLFCCCYC